MSLIARARVLLVEDELIVAYDLAERLERMGCEVSNIVDTATEAIYSATQQRPDLALIDIELKGSLRGTDAAAIFQERGIPVVYLSAFSDDETLKTAAQTQPLGYLTKPVRTEDLRTTLAMALARCPQSGPTPERLSAPTHQQLADAASAHALYHALDGNQFELYYQPQIGLGDRSLVGAEALVRWPQGNGQMRSPADFIPLAERTGLIVALGDWVLKTACLQAQRWHQLPRMAVNLSVHQLEQPGFPQQVADILAQTDLDPQRLELEVTESLLLAQDDHTAQMLMQLRQLGVHITVDDFGAGYSSLRYLQTLAFSCLKIDRCFIKNIHQQSSNQAIVKAVIQMAQALELTVVAEGIETPEEAQFLRACACPVGQGFLFSPPLPAASFSHNYNLSLPLISPVE